jgi:undecaprenyl diphosphate synthase
MIQLHRLKHLAIIMDGNGRWAKQQSLNRTAGHQRGADVVRDITTYCNNIGIEYLTLYAFSTENWKRPKLEVEFLMKLLDKYLKKELHIYLRDNVKFKAIGNISMFSKALQKRIKDTEDATKECTGLTQILALNYGSRDEIVRAVNKAIANNEKINEESISKNLDTALAPDVDLLIRTSGELRISNYLLWQIAYSELFFTETLWPDFTTQELEGIIEDYRTRDRRFGGI